MATDEQITYQDLKNLLDPEYTLFGHEFNQGIKLQHRVEVINKQIVIHQDQISTKRFNQILKLVKDHGGQGEQQDYMDDRQWEDQYMREQEGDGDQDGWVTEEEQENYVEENIHIHSPMKDIGVMSIEYENERNKNQSQYRE